MGFLKVAWDWVSGSWVSIAVYAAIAAVVAFLWFDHNRRVADEAISKANVAVATQAAKENLNYAHDVELQSLHVQDALVFEGGAELEAFKNSQIIIEQVESVPTQPLSPALSCYVEQLYKRADVDSDQAARLASTPGVTTGLQEACTARP